MKPYTIGFLLLMSTAYVNMKNLNILDDIFAHTLPASVNIEKREISKNTDQFIEEKLIEHSQALQHIIRILGRHQEITEQLLEHLTMNTEQSKLPILIESTNTKPDNTRRSYDVVENPVFRIGKNIPKYGRLATDLFLKEMNSDIDPVPLIDTESELTSTVDLLELSKSDRRLFDDGQDIHSNQQKLLKPNHWCEIAVLCKNTTEPRFDDSYGNGEFDEICHILIKC